MPIPPDREASDREAPGLDSPRMHEGSSAGGFARSVLGLAAGAIGLVLAFMFSLVLVAILVGAGIVIGGWFWWKTRKLRQQLRERPPQARRPGEREVEGEVVAVDAAERGKTR